MFICGKKKTSNVPHLSHAYKKQLKKIEPYLYIIFIRHNTARIFLSLCEYMSPRRFMFITRTRSCDTLLVYYY